MKLPIYQINSFASGPFSGNPAAVCPLPNWVEDDLLQRIAAETQLTTAFLVGKDGEYELRWFTPDTEISGICGHGTLAAAFVAATELDDNADSIGFSIKAKRKILVSQDQLTVLSFHIGHSNLTAIRSSAFTGRERGRR